MDTTVVAEHDYDGENDSQLTFKAGDRVVVLKQDESGWWTGRLEKNGKEGSFPSMYVKVIKPIVDKEQTAEQVAAKDKQTASNGTDLHSASGGDSASKLKWQDHWRANPAKGMKFYLKRIWFLGVMNAGLATYIYYLNNYRKDLPLFQRQSLIAAGSGYVLREFLSFFYIAPNRVIKTEDLINIVMGSVAFVLPAYFAKSSDQFSLSTNTAIHYSALLLSIGGHLFNSFAEMQRKWWMSKPENEGKVYTEGFFSITRHPNYLGDVMFFTGWNLLSRDVKPVLFALSQIYTFYTEFIPEIEEFMQKKHGKEWEDYVRKVKSSLIPGIPI